MFPLEENKYALKTWKQAFISVHKSNTGKVMHTSRKQTSDCEWIIINGDNGLVTLQSAKTNLYISAEPEGEIACNRDAPDDWEKFNLVLAAGQQVMLKCKRDRFLTVENEKYATLLFAC